jgi:hypothetical protein
VPTCVPVGVAAIAAGAVIARARVAAPAARAFNPIIGTVSAATASTTVAKNTIRFILMIVVLSLSKKKIRKKPSCLGTAHPDLIDVHSRALRQYRGRFPMTRTCAAFFKTSQLASTQANKPILEFKYRRLISVAPEPDSKLRSDQTHR